jgi:drug/metabolite transporter (DMT)-like permease
VARPVSETADARRHRHGVLAHPARRELGHDATSQGASRARRYEGLAWAFLGVVLFSFSVPLTKVAVRGFEPTVTAMGRAAIAGGLALLPLALGRLPRPARADLRPLFVTMLGAVFGWPILIALALDRTTSAHVAVLAAFMPLTTALIAVLRTHERVSWEFWAAASLGAAALVAFAVSRGGAEGGDLLADAFVVGAVFSSSWCYVEGASITRRMPGWQVISWVVLLALPLTVPLWAVLWWESAGRYDPSAAAWGSLAALGVVSMYLAFFVWYRGLSLAGIARGGQVQQLQALLTLLWSALFLGEQISLVTVTVALVVTSAVVWAQRTRTAPAPIE